MAKTSLTNIGVLFVNKQLTAKSGAIYYSGKSEGSETFDLMGFLKTAKNGTKYISIVQLKDETAGQVVILPTPKEELPKVANIDPDDLPF